MHICVLDKGYILHIYPVNYCVSMSLNLQRPFNPQEKHITPYLNFISHSKDYEDYSLLEYDVV
jgi:hypothetical protein